MLGFALMLPLVATEFWPTMVGVSRFSARTSWDVGESSYAAAVREARASGRKLYDLTISNPTRCGFVYDAALLGALGDLRALVYDPDPRGMVVAREAVAGYYAGHGARVSVADLVLATSTSESYSFLFRLLCDAGDEVLVAQPSYPLFDFLADLDDVRLRPYPLFYDHGWWIDLAELERAVTPRTRAMIVVHPNNPTGHWTGAGEREALEALCVRRGLALIVDEVFLDYGLEGRHVAGAKAHIDPSPEMPGLKSRPILNEGDVEVRSFACGEHPALTFVLSGLSKIAGLPQMKAAWIATLGPEGARAEALGRLEIVADTFLAMNAPVQLAMPKWLAGAGAIQEQIVERARENLTTLRRMAAETPGRLQVLEVEAGWSAVLGLPGCVGETDCAERLVRERGVIVHPGGFYGMGERNRVVVSLIGAAREFEEGMRRAIA
jgi:aspartate/methionine/tyrosine aminotransferase